VVEGRRGEYVFDFRKLENTQRYQVRELTRMQALSRYYSNLGAEAIRGGDPMGAYRHLMISIQLDTKSANAWNNLGVVLRHLGYTAKAGAAYCMAFEQDNTFRAPLENMALLLFLDERFGDAALVYGQVYPAGSNPYLWVERAVEAAPGEDVDVYLKRAERLLPGSERVEGTLVTLRRQIGTRKTTRNVLK
jgi:tetratricopeptide (TPR) repeat protein